MKKIGALVVCLGLPIAAQAYTEIGNRVEASTEVTVVEAPTITLTMASVGQTLGRPGDPVGTATVTSTQPTKVYIQCKNGSKYNRPSDGVSQVICRFNDYTSSDSQYIGVTAPNTANSNWKLHNDNWYRWLSTTEATTHTLPLVVSTEQLKPGAHTLTLIAQAFIN